MQAVAVIEVESILGAGRPRLLPVCAPPAHEPVDLRPHNGTNRCATAPKLRHRFHHCFPMALQSHELIDDLLPRWLRTDRNPGAAAKDSPA